VVVAVAVAVAVAAGRKPESAYKMLIIKTFSFPEYASLKICSKQAVS